MLTRAALARPTTPAEGPLAVHSAMQLVGNTPLVELRRARDGVAPGVRVYAKLEGWDPLESTCRHASLSIL